jgi:hypothetical protein
MYALIQVSSGVKTCYCVDYDTVNWGIDISTTCTDHTARKTQLTIYQRSSSNIYTHGKYLYVCIWYMYVTHFVFTIQLLTCKVIVFMNLHSMDSLLFLLWSLSISSNISFGNPRCPSISHITYDLLT